MIVEFEKAVDMNIFIAAMCRDDVSFYMAGHKLVFQEDLPAESEKVLGGLPHKIVSLPPDEEDTQEIKVPPLAISEGVEAAFEKSMLKSILERLKGRTKK